MEEQKKSRKPLLVGVIAAVVVLVALLALLLTQCVGGMGPSDTSGTETTAPVMQLPDLYWNVDRNNFEAIEGESTTGRKPADDGFYHMVFAIDGKQVELRVKERRLVNIIDAFDIVGLVFDENGDVIDVIRLDDMPYQKLTWQYYIQSFGGNAIKLNSSKDMNGMEEMIKTNDQTVIYDVSGWSEFVGAPGKLQKNDRAYVLADEEGNVTHIFLYERDGIERTVRAECKHCGEEVTWKNWLKKDSLPITTGHYFLENNVDTKKQNQIQDDAKICLDLNGYQVYSNSTARIYSTFYAGSSLAVMDNSEEKKGIMISEGQNMDQGSVLWARYGNIDIYDITVDGSGATSHAGGTAVCVESTSIMTFHSGKLIGGKLVTVKGKHNSQVGATVLVNGSGKFIMEAGTTIIGGETPRFGGAVAVNGKGTFTMNGGKISGGRTKGMNGGAVAVTSKDATFIMNSGTITGGRAYKSDKNANGAGGNVYLLNGTFNMYGGTITGGRAYNYDGTLDEDDPRQNFFNVNGKLYMYGGKINGSMQAVDTNLKDTNPCLVYVSGSAKITGAPEGMTNLTLNNGVKFQAGKLSGKAEIYVTASGLFSEKTRESNVQYVHSDDPNVGVVYYNERLGMGRLQCICGASLTEGKAHVGNCDGALLFYGPYNNQISKNVSGNYYLTKDYENLVQLSFGSSTTKDADGKTVYPDPITINLDLNGHTINSSNRSILALSMTTLNITDSVGGGKITGRGVAMPYTNAGVLLMQKYTEVNILGDLTLDGRDDMHETMRTGGVAEVAGVLNMYHGTLDGGPVGGSTDEKGNVLNGSGGAVRLVSGGILNMYNDAKITGGVTKGPSGHGGNVYVAGGSQLNMFDNSVIENGSASVENGGGGGNVYVAANATLSLQDNAKIVNGNTDPTKQPHTKDVFAVGAKVIMNGGHIGTMALTNWNANNTKLSVANNASIELLRRTYGNDKGKNGATDYTIIDVIGVLADDAKIVLSAPSIGFFTSETVVENKDNFATNNDQQIFFNEKYKKLSVGEVGETLYHCVCGMQHAESLEGTVTSKGACFGACDGTIKEWKPWTGNTMPNKEGYWVMSSGTYAVGTVGAWKGDAGTEESPNVSIFVDLNGKEVVVAKNNRAFGFGTLNKAELTITDGVGGGKLVSAASNNADQGLIAWNRSARTVTFNLYAGTLDASAVNTTTESPYGGQGAVELNVNAVINLYGGVVRGQNIEKGNKDKNTGEIISHSGQGGAFYLRKGTVMTMSGNAVVYGGKVAQNGGAVYIGTGASLIMNDNAKITGGEITGAMQTDTHGGNVFVGNGASLVMNDNASIVDGIAMNAYTYKDKNTGATKHRSAQGGNVYANGSITLNGNASITGGACDTYNLTEPDPKAQNADIFLVGEYASLTMNGGKTGYVTVASDPGKVTVSGAAVVERFKLNGAWVIDINGTLADDALITLNNPAKGLFTGETVAANADNFKTSNGIPVSYSKADKKLNVGIITEPVYHCVCGAKHADSIDGPLTKDETCIGACTGKIEEWKPWTGTTMPNTAGYWYINDASAAYSTAYIKKASDIFVDLNGLNVKLNHRAYRFDGDATGYHASLTITDSVGGATLKTNELTDTHSMLLWAYHNNATVPTVTFEQYGGHMDVSAVSGTKQWANIGAINLGEDAVINIFGGKVTGMTIAGKNGANVADRGDGAAFYLAKGTFMTVSGGAEIIGGTAHAGGGAIYVASGATLVVNDATITGGQAAQGAAIFSAGNVLIEDATINGGVAVRDTAANKGGQGAAIYVKEGTLTLDNAVVNGGHVDVLDEKDANAYGGNAICVAGGAVTAQNGTKLNGYTAEHSNVRRGGTVAVHGGTFTLDNSTISGSKVQVNAAAVHVYSGTFTMKGENAAITMADVGSKTYGGAVTVENNGCLKLENGTINGTEVTNSTYGGGAVAVVSDNAKLEITGGKITGGKSTKNLGGGVYLMKGSLSISGDAQITGNEGGNLYIADGLKIEVGTMGANANVGVTLATGTGIFSSNIAAATGFVADNSAYQVKALTSSGKLAVVDPADPNEPTEGTTAPESSDPSETTTPGGEPATGDSIFHCLCGKQYAESLTAAPSTRGECLEGCDGTIVEWTKWTETTKLPNTDGYYFLADNVSTTATTALGAEANYDANVTETRNVAIDLNGKTVSTTAARVFVLGKLKSATLTITDPVGTGVINTKDCTSGTTSTDQGSILWNRGTGKSTVNIFGGTIDASKSDTNLKTQYGGQGAIDIGSMCGADHVLNIAGGTIKGQNITKDKKVTKNSNTGNLVVGTDAFYGNGGAIYVKNTTVTISGDAKIYGGNVSGNGGAIYVGTGATVTIKDNAEITGGHARVGGNISVDGTLIMDGGKVTSGVSTSYGGNIFVNKTFNLNKGLITLGTSGSTASTAHGGGLYVSGTGTVNMAGGEITDNTATIGGGGMYLAGGATLNISGGSITGNNAAASQITNFDVNSINGKIYASGGTMGVVAAYSYQNATGTTIAVSGKPVIQKLTLNSSDSATVDSPATVIKLMTDPQGSVIGLENGASIGVAHHNAVKANNNVFTEANEVFKNYVDYFYCTNGTSGVKYDETAQVLKLVENYYCLCATKTGTHLEGCDGTKHEWTAWDLSSKTTLPTAAVGEEKYYYLTGTPAANLQDAIVGLWAGESADAQGDVKLAVDLRGKDLTIASGHRAFVFGQQATATLSITDSVGGASITNQASTTAAQGMMIWNRATIAATLNIFGGTFDSRQVDISATSTAGSLEGAIDMIEGDTVNITGNTVIYGQNVTKGTTGEGGAINFRATNKWAGTATLKLSGDAKIYGSTVSAYGGAVSSDVSVAITMKDNAEIIGGTAAIRGGAVYMGTGGSLTMSDNAKIRDGQVVSTLTTKPATGSTANDPYGGNVYSGGTATITMSDNAQISGGVVDAQLNNTHGGNLFMNGGNQTLTMSGNAKITGGNTKKGQGGNVYTNGIINISGNAEITGGMLNTNTTAVNADVFAVNGNLNMNGGKIGYIAAWNSEAAGTNVVKLEGEPVITLLSLISGSTNKDIFATVSITGTLGDNASIGMNLSAPVAKNIYEFTTATVKENADNFTCAQGTIVFNSATAKLAVATPDMYCLCAATKTGGEHKNGCTGEVHKWTKWEKTDSLPTTDGYYYLADNVTTSAPAIYGAEANYDANVTETRNVAIDLNGKTVSTTAGRVFVLGQLQSATLTITDSVGTAVVNTKDCTSGTTSVDQGSFLWNRGTGVSTVNIFGGTIDASKSDTNLKTQWGGQGAIDIGSMCGTGHVLNIAGGTIKGQNITKNVKVNSDLTVTTDPFYGCGGAIYINNTTLTISGDAQIYGSNVSGYGGAIYVKNSTLNMIGGTVYGGNAINGGAIYLESGSVEMSAGTITGGTVANADTTNATSYGGNVFVKGGTFNMSGTALITEGANNGGNTNSHGGNVSVQGGSFSMSGDAKVTNGHANKGQGGNVHVTATLNISGNAEISGGQGVTEGVVSRDIFCVNGKVNMDGGHIASIALTNTNTSKAAAQLSVKGAAKADFINLGKTAGTTYYSNVVLAGALTDGACVKINTVAGQTIIPRGEITEETWATYSTYLADNKIMSAHATNRLFYTTYGFVGVAPVAEGSLQHCLCATKSGPHMEGCDGTPHEWKAWTGIGMPNQAGYWYMDDESKTYVQGVISGDNVAIYVDLNGKTINYDTRAFRFDSPSDATTQANMSLTITDSVGGGSMNITKSLDNHCAGMMSYKNGTTVTPKVTFTMYGGHLNASAASCTGLWENKGAITLGENATINMYGGKISGQTINGLNNSNPAANVGQGGAVYLDKNSNMIMSGDAEIVGGAVAQNAGSVFMDGNTTLTMSGNAKISGGSTTGSAAYDTHGGNVFVSGGATLTMSGNALITGGSSMNSFDGRSAYGGNVYVNGNLNISGNAAISGGASMSSATSTAPSATDARADIFNVGGTITLDGGYIGRIMCASSVPGTINVGGAAEILQLQTPDAVNITKALTDGASITVNKNAGTKVADIGSWSATELAGFAGYFHGNSGTTGVAEADGIYLRAQ